MTPSSVRFPDVASIEAVLTGLDPRAADAQLAPALAAAFPSFDFRLVRIDEDYWRDTRSVLQADGSRLGELRPWMTAEIAKDGGHIKAVWQRLKETDLQITEWRGTTAFVFAPDRTARGRLSSDHARPRDRMACRPDRQSGLSTLGRRGTARSELAPHRSASRLGSPRRPGLSPAQTRRRRRRYVRSFLDRCGRIERDKREAGRPELERRVIREVGPGGTTRETPFLEAPPDYFDFVPRELRFFQDWEDSSARAQRVFAHWALDIRDYAHKGEREVGFIPRPLRQPKERLLMTPEASVHLLMDRTGAVDREVGLPFGWFFLMTHGHWVDPDVGHTIAEGVKAQRVRLPDPDARVLLRRADRTYGF